MTIRFGPFSFDISTRLLTRDARPIHISPKAFELLAALLADRPNVLTKADLQEELWPSTFVAEANLSNLVAELREALGDRARAPVFIRTVHGFGYAFCGDAADVPANAPPTDRPACWLEWGRQRFPLGEGAHVLGRDPYAQVRLDAATVSRLHARLIVRADGALLEDSGSKNGTFHGNARVTTPVRLADGDAIGIGSLRLTFHAHGDPQSTETQSLPAE